MPEEGSAPSYGATAFARIKSEGLAEPKLDPARQEVRLRLAILESAPSHGATAFARIKSEGWCRRRESNPHGG